MEQACAEDNIEPVAWRALCGAQEVGPEFSDDGRSTIIRDLSPADTSEAAAALQRQAQQALTPDERVRLAVQLSQDLRTVLLDGFRSRDPAATEGELSRQLMLTLYGDVWQRLAPDP